MATPAISAHWSHLQRRGLDLGAAKGAEVDAGFGGKFQAYELGTIFWHPSTGAHALRGRMLQRYLGAGGPGPNESGERELGFPTSGHIRTRDARYECAKFEFGVIEDIPETPLVKIFGPVYRAWLAHDDSLGMLGHPVCDVTNVSTGRMAWFERGVIWHPSGTDEPLIGELVAPTLGHPLLIDPGSPGLFTWIKFHGQVAYLDSVPGLAEELVRNRLKLTGVGEPVAILDLKYAGLTTRGAERWLQLSIGGQGGTGGRFANLHAAHGDLDRAVSVSDGQSTSGGGTPVARKLERRRLYNLALLVPGQAPITISAHCLYARNDWETFGIAHITDTHVSLRIEFFRAALRKAGIAESDIAMFNNWNDRFREFIRYANHLHATGLLDVILLTGDVVDYVLEAGEPLNSPGNFAFFEALVRGRAPSRDADGSPSEELRVPIFTSLGNHDYRFTAYPLAFGVNLRTSDLIGDILNEIPLIGDAIEDAMHSFEDLLYSVPGVGAIQHADVIGKVGSRLAPVTHRNGPFNLLKDEAVRIMGLKDGDEYVVANLRPEGAAKAIILHRQMKDGRHYYFRHLNRDRSYIIALGAHRIAMLDTKWDDGIGEGVIAALVGTQLGGLGDEALKNFFSGSPDSVGITQEELAMVRTALREAGQNGIVIVGMHAPPINLPNSEQPICVRETIHPTTDPNQILGLLKRNKVVPALHPNWLLEGTPYFHVGSLEDMLDHGTSSSHKDELAETFAGRNADRPVNLVLSGHGHYRMEFRFAWNASQNHLEAYTDHYLATPDSFYSTRIVEGDYNNDDNTKIYLTRVEPGAPVQGEVQKITEHRPTIWPDLSLVRVPPFSDPLSNATDTRQWWAKYSPIVTQTAALGPSDNSRASLTEHDRQPSPNQQGFRVIQVKDNVIDRVHYIHAEALRASYPMAWENVRPTAPQLPVVDATILVGQPVLPIEGVFLHITPPGPSAPGRNVVEPDTP